MKNNNKNIMFRTVISLCVFFLITPKYNILVGALTLAHDGNKIGNNSFTDPNQTTSELLSTVTTISANQTTETNISFKPGVGTESERVEVESLINEKNGNSSLGVLESNAKVTSQILARSINSGPVKENKPTQESKVTELKLNDLNDDLEDWDPPELLTKGFPYYLAGYDEENRPIWISEPGKANLRKIVEEGGENFLAMDKYVRQAANRIKKSGFAKTPDKDVNDLEIRYIMDFEGLTIQQLSHLPTMTYLLRLARQYKDVILDNLGPSVIINANFLTELLVNLMKPILGAGLVHVNIYGSNKAKWIPRLRQQFPLEAIPPWYGGTKDFKPIKLYG